MSHILMMDVNGQYQAISRDSIDEYLRDSGVTLFGASKREIRAFLKGWQSLNRGEMPTQDNITKFFEEIRNERIEQQ